MKQPPLPGALAPRALYLLTFAQANSYDVDNLVDVRAFLKAAYGVMPDPLRTPPDKAAEQVDMKLLNDAFKQLGARRSDPRPASQHHTPVTSVRPSQLPLFEFRTWCLGQARYVMLPTKNRLLEAAEEWALEHPDEELNIEAFVQGVLEEAGVS